MPVSQPVSRTAGRGDLTVREPRGSVPVRERRLMTEPELIVRLEQELRACQDLGLLNNGTGQPLTAVWQRHLREQPPRFLRADGRMDVERLRNFRKLSIFVSDVPSFPPHRISLRNLLGGGRRGSVRMLVENLEVLKQHGYDDLLKQYPCSTVGNPYIFRSGGCQFTHRWLRDIYFLGLLNQVLGDRLNGEFVALDIGSSHGGFSSLLKREYPAAHCVLVDFPEQLLLAYYFLGTCFPNARFAGVAEIATLNTIPRSFLEAYDFIFIPCSYYARMEARSVDLVTNFVSFGEMTPSWFRAYVEGAPFVTATWFFTVNRVQSQPTYDSNLTILDYPVWNPEKRLHFGLCPALSHYYVRRNLFFTERRAFSPFFEYLGEI